MIVRLCDECKLPVENKPGIVFHECCPPCPIAEGIYHERCFDALDHHGINGEDLIEPEEK